MKIEQENTPSMPALLCNVCGVDAQKIKSLCCEAAGIIDPVSATAEALIPHEKLREAASVDATLIARERPPAQPVVGYKPPSQSDERDEYEKEFPVSEGLQYCANRDTYIRAAGSSPSDKFAREHYAYRAGFAAWMRRAWKQVSTDLATERGDGFTCWGTKTQLSAVPLTAQITHQFIANQAAAALTDTFRAYTGEETAWCAIKAEELEQLKVEEAREQLELFNRQQSRTALSTSVEPAKCCNCGACPVGCVAAARAQESAPICSCPSGDGSLRWPCKVHPPVADGVGADPMYRPSNAQEASE
ncbi:hypothetical protein [Pseudomonas chlororaphis]|uniref:4Fe-4S ferredoxin-type domain-containing protein n=1 Tax=Pseudomonas chlororaphis TaxID=587753 RepID=A0AAX3G8J6_9PSED|nr:hypothetical protein [Pseudomonas chlororaphis]AZC37081.1 hypothetical protein C4K37_2694 [Pseudomonas chlororaphis subsp. piscium]AZC43627.1 hypothetical protein C4K36_2702 [Pseudomonas chlororaphis subsp. piscium]WDG75490.1 hypothetical protein PUP65_14295 [Pseudomonas chlororaphis]WDH26874.1 hypothetical protein PUP81_20015 [Pseudomonas chlororaphis]WDH74010.1 hypothetical protein PUP78_14290 [Pseudomonas chlororaphis]